MHHVIWAAGHVFMSAGNYVTLEVETSQARTIDYGHKLAYKELKPWFDLETHCGHLTKGI